MRQKVLKALANPARIFYVPYNLALINFFVWFLLFIVCLFVFLIFTGDIPPILPLVFCGILSLCHIILGFYSKKEPQLAQIIFSSLNLIRHRIPRKLVV